MRYTTMRSRALALRRALLTLLLLLAGGGGGTTALAETAFPIKPSANGRYFVDQQNRPFFYHADTAWTITKKLTKEEIAEYLDDRKAKGFTAIQVHTMSKEQGPVENREGHGPFNPPDDILKPNEEYWRNVDDVVRAARERNILVGMSAIWIRWGGKDEQGWRAQLTDEKARAYGLFLGRRYRSFNNLIWILGGDANPIERTKAIAEIAKALRETAPQQLITVHNRPDNSSSAFFEVEPWLDVNMAYTYRETYIHVLGEWNRLGRARPIFLGESGYEEESNDERGGSPLRMRRQVYGAILSGSLGGHAFGHKHVWRFSDEWRKALASPANRQMSHVKDVFTSLAWYRLVPDQFNELVTGGRGYFGDVEYVTAARADDGSFAVIYLPMTTTVTLNMNKLKSGASAAWFDPVTGQRQEAKGIGEAAARQFTPPSKNSAGDADFLLLVGSQR